MLNFVNYKGEPINASGAPQYATKPKPLPRESYHDGWRVEGIPPGALEEARESHARETRMAQSQGAKLPKPWDEDNWLMNAKKKAVRGKPYEVPEAAEQCADLARKAGWLRVVVTERKKDAQA